MTEKQFQEAVTAFARLTGWRVYHTRDSRGSEAGFPDLVMVRGPRIRFVELKSGRGHVTPEQDQWLALLEDVEYMEVGVWRPSDWMNGNIETCLR